MQAGGPVAYGYQNDDGLGWTLTSGQGGTFTGPAIAFSPQFTKTPTVIVTIAGIDASNGANLRIVAQAVSVTPDQFQVQLQTWGDSVIYTVWVCWAAYG